MSFSELKETGIYNPELKVDMFDILRKKLQ